MSFKSKIQEDLIAALKENKETKVSVLRLLKAAIFNKEKEKRYKISKTEEELDEEELVKKSQLTEEEIVEVIVSEIKKRKEAIDLYEKGNRPELAEKEKMEIKILESYLPKQLSEEEIKKIVQEAIKKVGVKEMKDYNPPTVPQGKNIYGKVMAEVMPKIKGKADGSLVSKIVKELLK